MVKLFKYISRSHSFHNKFNGYNNETSAVESPEGLFRPTTLFPENGGTKRAHSFRHTNQNNGYNLQQRRNSERKGKVSYVEVLL